MPKEYNKDYSDRNIFTRKEDNASFYKKLLGMEEQYYKTRNKLAEKYHLERIRKELNNEKLSIEQRKKFEENLAKTVVQIEKEAVLATEILWNNRYKRASAAEKAEMIRSKAARLKIEAETVQEEIELRKVIGDTKDDEYKELKKLEQQYQKQVVALNKQSAKQQVNDLKAIRTGGVKSMAAFALKYDKQEREKQKDATKKQLNDDLKKKQEAAKKLADWQDRYERAKAEGKVTDENREWYESRIAGAQSRYDQASSDAKDSRIAAALSDVVDSIANLGSHFTNLVSDAQAQADSMLTSYQSRVNASLQGSDKNFGDILDKIQDNLAISPVVQMKDVVDNIRTASDQGIVYNLEQRAFLNTISEKIAHTFDAFDSNLTRLIRLQQADTTAARLGMEASLTKLFNSTFNDSSYLSDVYDSVSQAIIDANSQMEKNQSAEFEYVVQKWLGSLYSLGLSEGTVTQIAEGINYLATGDVTSLASNTNLQTLMAMSASNAGLDFAQIMLDGLDASTTNQLLESMVMYLKDIAENSDSQVVKSAYGDIFNMSLSDMKAISNMTSADISRISGTTLNYSGMMSEVQSQLLQTVMRSSLSENMNNVYQNALYGMGIDMASNPATWTMDKMLKFMKENNIDINLPFINVFGSGLDLNTSVVGLLEMGLGLSGAMSLIGNVLGGLGTSGGGTGLSLSDWGGTEYNQRGTGIGGLLGTMIGGTSSSTYVANSSSSDMSNDAIATATDDAAETEKITNKNAAKNDHTLDDFWNATIGESASDYLKVQDVLLFAVYENGRLRTTDSGIELVRNNDFLRVQDNNTAFLSYLTFDATRALRTVVTNSSITARIANASDIANAVRQSQPQSMAIAGTVNINKSTLVNAIIEAFSGSENNIKLKQFIDGSLQNSNGSTPPTFKVKNEDGKDLNVRVSNYQLFNI